MTLTIIFLLDLQSDIYQSYDCTFWKAKLNYTEYCQDLNVAKSDIDLIQ